MKIKQIIDAFSQEIVNGQPVDKPVIVKVFDSVKEFKRKLELMPAYKELKEVNQTFNGERQKIINEIVEKYNKETNSNVQSVPAAKMPEFAGRINEILSTDYTMKKKLKFSKKEIEDSGINLSEMLLVEEFIL